MRNTLLALGTAITVASCVTANPANPDNTGCTNPKLAMMSNDVANSINMALIDMHLIAILPETKTHWANYRAAENDPPITFVHRSMLLNGTNATLCDVGDTDTINCYVGQVGDLSQDPVPLHDLRTVSLTTNTVSLNRPVDSQHPLGFEWISVDPPNKVCGVQNRYGTSARWCYDPFTGEQPKDDLARESACAKDFNTSRDAVKAQLDAYLKRLAQ